MQIRLTALATSLLLFTAAPVLAEELRPARIQPTQPITISENERQLAYTPQTHTAVQPQPAYVAPAAHTPAPEPITPTPFKVDIMSLSNF